MRFGLNESTIRAIHQVLARHPQVEEAIIYGSRAKGNFRPGSDIDLTLNGGRSLDWDVLYRIILELEDLPLPYSFDVSLLHKIDDPDVIDHIRHVGLPFYKRKFSQPTTFKALQVRTGGYS